MKTYTEKRIELGQDINNAWALVAAIRPVTSCSLDDLRKEFRAIYRLVRDESKVVREEADRVDAKLGGS